MSKNWFEKYILGRDYKKEAIEMAKSISKSIYISEKSGRILAFSDNNAIMEFGPEKSVSDIISELNRVRELSLRNNKKVYKYIMEEKDERLANAYEKICECQDIFENLGESELVSLAEELKRNVEQVRFSK